MRTRRVAVDTEGRLLGNLESAGDTQDADSLGDLLKRVQPGVWLERHGRDRYRRTLAIVRDRAGRDLAQVLIREGLARPYNGRGRRQGWC